MLKIIILILNLWGFSKTHQHLPHTTHNLRNAYKTENIIGRTLLEALNGHFKLLLTATPLNNSLPELYGLSRFIDNYIFGDLDSFKIQFSFLRDENKHAFEDLVARVRMFCIRTLRRQVTDFF